MIMHVAEMMIVRAQNIWFTLRDRESGQTLVEYALILTLIALASVAALTILGGKISGLFEEAGSAFP